MRSSISSENIFRKMLSRSAQVLVVMSLVFGLVIPQTEAASTGKVQGQVIDAVTQAPIIGATVMVEGTDKGTATDSLGRYIIKNLPVGGYSLLYRSIGYRSQTRTDIIVRPNRISFVDMKLASEAVEIRGSVSRSSYFNAPEEQTSSSIGFSQEEIRRSPGSAGDVSRIISIMPSVAKVNDQLNSLIVRGGSPAENGFYLDNIEIPNINHYPLPGTSGGPISLLNVDFISDATFSAGGFSAEYGDRLSSIVNLKFREGNREEFDGQVDMHFAGFGLALEGPLSSGKGSWMFSVRRSFLDLLVDAIGTGVAPKYSDYQGKLVYDLSPSNRLTFLGVAGIDYIEFTKEQSMEDGNNFYGEWDGYEYVFGMDWRYLWSTHGYSNTSVSVLATNLKGTFYETKSDIEISDENSLERIWQIRNGNTYQLSPRSHIEFGFDAKQIDNDYNFEIAEYTNPIGDTLPPLIVHDVAQTPKLGGFTSLSFTPFGSLTTKVGLRYDYFEYNDRSHLSPRFSATYKLSGDSWITAAAGLYYQNLPLSLIIQRERNKALNDPMAMHYILGVSRLLGSSTRLTVEGFYKDYQNFPMDRFQPQMFVADEQVSRGYVGNYENLSDDGKARSYGIEMTLQKKMVEGLYGLVSGSWSRAQYLGLDDVWRNRIIDNKFLFGVEGGYRPNNKWEYSIRWVFAGGPPYTPLDEVISALINRTVFDSERINEERYPDYHSMNVRVDRRFNYSSSNLVVFFSIWNIYNRENVAIYYWNETDKKQDVLYQWTILPVFGLEFEF